MPRKIRKILLVIIMGLVLLLLLSNAREIWSRVAAITQWLLVNAKEISINLVASLFWVILTALVVLFRERLWQWMRGLFLTSEEKRLQEEREYSERLYLANIGAKIRQDEPRWDTHLYVPLTATENYDRLGFRPEMILVSRRIRPPLTGINEDEEGLGFIRGRRVDLLDLLRRRERLVVLGEPGCGKTVAMRQLSLLAADEAKKKPRSQRRLPMFIGMRSYTGVMPDGRPQPVIDFIRDYITAEMPRYGDFLVAELEDYLAEGRLLVLFDGLNEMPPDDYAPRLQALKAFAGDWPRSKFIFTCRTFHHDPLFNIREVVINRLTERKIEQFARNYLGVRKGRLFVETLNAGDRRLVRDCCIPYFLALAVGLFAKDGSLPNTRAGLFTAFITAMLEVVAIGKSLAPDMIQRRVFSMLCPLAFAMNRAKLLGTEVTLGWVTEAVTDPYDESVLRLAREAGLLDITSENRVRFAHHILQEYFAALALMEQITKRDEQVRIYLSDPWWVETVALLAGLLPQPEELIRLVLATGKRTSSSIWLSARCVASSSVAADSLIYRELCEAIESELESENVFSTARALRALGELGDAKSIRRAGKYLDSENPWLQETAFLAVVSSTNPEARQEQIRIFREHLPWRRILTLIRSYVPAERRFEIVGNIVRGFLPWMIVLLFVSLFWLVLLGVLKNTIGWTNLDYWVVSISNSLLAAALLLLTLLFRPRGSIVFIVSALMSALLFLVHQATMGYTDIDLDVETTIILLLLAVLALSAYVTEQGVRAAKSWMRTSRARDRLIFEWALSWKGLLLCMYFLLTIPIVLFILTFRQYAVRNMLFVALGPGFPVMSRFVFGGLLLFSSVFLIVPLPAGILSMIAQIRNAFGLIQLRQLEKSSFVSPDQAQLQRVQVAEEMVRNPFTPSVVRKKAIVVWSRQVAPVQALPLLVGVTLESDEPVEVRGTAQKAIDEISNRWSRQLHEDSFDANLTEALLSLVLTPGKLSDEAKEALLNWINRPPESHEKHVILAAAGLDSGP